MYQPIQLKTRTLLVIILLVWLGVLPKAQAVVPALDGGYPGFTTAEGTNALQNLTTGVGNTAAGWHSLFANSAGNLNTAIGAGTLLFNTGDDNTATGALALLIPPAHIIRGRAIEHCLATPPVASIPPTAPERYLATP
jgi:hypothetical protein